MVARRATTAMVPRRLLTLALTLTLALVAVLASTPAHATPPTKPNIVVLVADDWGWADAGFRRARTTPPRGAGTWDVIPPLTPNINRLVASGVLLDRFYVYRTCSPSRSAFLTGRVPTRVNIAQVSSFAVNPSDPVSGFFGIPRNMTTLGEAMTRAGYRTVYTGKWDVGLATPRHLPPGRGFAESLVFLQPNVDSWTTVMPKCSSNGPLNPFAPCSSIMMDLWNGTSPALIPALENGDVYLEDVFRDVSVSAIANHDKATMGPLFLVHAFQLVSAPGQVPFRAINRFSNAIDSDARMLNAAAVWYMDEMVGDIVQALEDAEMWDDTLVVMFSDNGGALDVGGNNFPLKGGKYTDWDGGVRVNAFVSGGVVPPERRGRNVSELVSVADLFATFVRLGTFGVDDGAPGGNATREAEIQDEVAGLVEDREAAAVSPPLPPVFSVDVWPQIVGVEPVVARTEVHVSPNALVQGRMKFVTGPMPLATWTGPRYPNTTSGAMLPPPGQFGLTGNGGPTRRPTKPPTPVGGDSDRGGKTTSSPTKSGKPVLPAFVMECGAFGCLFDVVADPSERVNLARDPAYVSVRLAMSSRLAALNAGNFLPNRGTSAGSVACSVALRQWNGTLGPFVGV